MSEEIISILMDKTTASMDIDTLAKKLKIKNKGLLQEELNRLVSKGVLDYSAKKNKYLLFENSHLIKARVGSTDKMGLTTVEVNGKKISILKKNLKGATYNDLVALDIDDNNNYGIVVRIIERDANNYVGEVITKNNKLYIKNKHLGLIEVPYNLDCVEGQKILLRHEAGNVIIKEIIGHKDDPGIDIKSILYDHGFSDEFNEDAKDELQNIPTNLTEEEIKKALLNGRVDYRANKIITMDCDDTKDIDDGLSIKKLPNGNFELKVFIADVSHYVKENSAIDEEAYKRATSVYPPGSVNPMLDHKISNGICSLNPNVDRLAMCYTTIIDRSGKVVDFKVEEAIINSKMKMTYSDVNNILLNDEIKEDYQDYLKEIYLMYELSLLIYKNLLSNGYLNFVSTESQITLDKDGLPEEINKRPTGPAQKIIEMFMLATNIELTNYAYYLGLPWVFRIHDEPNQDKLATTYKILDENTCLNFREKKKYTSNDIIKAIDILSKKENAHVFSRLLITCQSKAKYSVENIGHYAIGVPLYSHNTSPIRRYPDLINQRIIKSFLHNGIDYTLEKYEDLREQAIHCSIQEREAEAVEREASDMKKAEYFKEHIGEVYTGYISYVGQFGFWVVLDNTIEGFIHINNLPKDKYKYSENILSLIGKKHRYSIGDKIEINVKSTNKETGTIDFVISKEYINNEEKEDIKAKKKVKSI